MYDSVAPLIDRDVPQWLCLNIFSVNMCNNYTWCIYEKGKSWYMNRTLHFIHRHIIFDSADISHFRAWIAILYLSMQNPILLGVGVCRRRPTFFLLHNSKLFPGLMAKNEKNIKKSHRIKLWFKQELKPSTACFFFLGLWLKEFHPWKLPSHFNVFSCV